MNTATIWISAFFTLAIFSFLVKENVFYRFAEHVYVGCASGNLIVTTYHNYLRPTVANDLAQNGQWHLIVPIAIGLLMYTRFSPRASQWSRIPMAFWLGMSSGLTLAYTPAPFIGQITASFLSLNSVNNVFFLLGLLGTLAYFFFTVNEKNPLHVPYKVTSSIGRWTMMIALGAAFGSTVMARFSLLLGRMQFLLGDWLHLIR